MKKILLAGLVMALLLTTALAGCVVVKKDAGDLETRSYDLSGFTAVDIGSAFDYEVVRGDAYAVAVTADSDLFDYIEVEQYGATLKVGTEAVHWPKIVWNPTRLRVKITMPRLTGLGISGAAIGDVSGFDAGDDLEVSVSGASRLNLYDTAVGEADFDLSGASDVDLDMTAGGDAAFVLSGASDLDGDLTAGGDIDLDLSGASRLELRGAARNARLDASGASHLDMDSFAVNDAAVAFSGASRGVIRLDGRLDVDLSGASYLDYIGKPQLGAFDVSGGSELESRDG